MGKKKFHLVLYFRNSLNSSGGSFHPGSCYNGNLGVAKMKGSSATTSNGISIRFITPISTQHNALKKY